MWLDRCLQTEVCACNSIIGIPGNRVRNHPPVGDRGIESGTGGYTIETLGDQGDGIAKVERSYVVIAPRR